MAITLLQSATKNAGGASSSTLAFGSNVTAASLLLSHVWHGVDNDTLTSSDNLNGSYHLDIGDHSAGGALTAAILSVANAIAGATTVTFGGGGTSQLRVVTEEYSGIAPVSPLDQVQTSGQITNGTNFSSGATSATTQADELVVGNISVANSLASTAGAGFTLDTNSNSSRPSTEWKEVLAAGAQTATFTNTIATGVCLVATYKAAAGGGPADSATLLQFLRSPLAGPFTPTQFSQFPYSTFVPPPPQPPGPGVVAYVPLPGPGNGPDIRTMFAPAVRVYSTSPPSSGGGSAGDRWPYWPWIGRQGRY